MSAQDHRQLVGHFVEAIYNANEPDTADSFLSTEFVNRNPYPGHGSDRDAFKDVFRGFRSNFSELHIEVEHLTVDGDLVTEIRTTRAIHRDSGREVSWPGVSVMRIVNGQIVALGRR